MNIVKSIVLVLLWLVVSLWVQQAKAQDSDSTQRNSKTWDRFSINLGGFLASYNSDIKVASEQIGLGVLIDIEDVFGIESSTFAFRGGARYRFGKKLRNLVEVGYFGIYRNSSKTLEEELEIGDLLFPAGTKLDVKFDFTIIRAKYDYTFFQDDRVSLGASFGFFIVPMSLAVNTVSFEDHNTKFIAPLPLFGVRSDFKISNKFYWTQSVEFLYLAVRNYEGGILDLNIALEHRSFKNVAFGAGLNSNRLNVTVKKEDSAVDFFGSIGMNYTGLMLYAKYHF